MCVAVLQAARRVCAAEWILVCRAACPSPACLTLEVLVIAQCKHQLAAQLADALQTCAVIGVSDVQMTQMLLVS